MTHASLLEFLAHLRDLEVTLWVEDTELHYRAAPDILTPALLDEMARRKRDIIAFLQSAYQMAATDRPPLQAIPRDGPLPLSFAQQRLWFLEQLAPGLPTYNIPAAFELSGTLDEAALTAALNAILRRHEVLRTAFPTVEGEAVAVVSPDLTIGLTHHAPPAAPPAERRAAAYRQAVTAARRPFDLSDPPLLRAELWPLADDCHLLLLVIHHIVYDGWSIEILLAELADLYAAHVTGGSPTLPDLPLQYADYARWQRDWLHGETLAAQIAAWRDYLGPDHSLLPLPTDHPRPATQSFAGATQPLHIPPALHRQIIDLGQRVGATLFMTLLAAFKLLLYRYTGRSDIRVGTPVGNRTHSETELLIGFFVNTLVLTTDLAGQPTFLELLRRVRTSALTAYRYQELPFEKLVEALQPERTLSHQPLFQVMFVLETAPLPTLDLPDLTLTPLPEFRTGTAKFDLTLSLTETETGLTGFIEYSTDLFEAATIERLAAQLLTLLEGIVANPDQPLSHLPLLPAPERQRLLVDWNDPATGPSPTDCLHHIFEAQAARRPTAVAAICEGQRITYGELNERANQLAHYLQSRGVGPEVCVGLYLERSLEFVVALLGILKAGGAYVPLDHRLPPERLAFLLAEIKAPVVLTQAHLAAKLSPALGDSPPTQPPPARGRSLASPPVGGTEGGPPRILALDSDQATLTEQPRTNPTSPVTPANLMYVLFTSGSTGQPKGVEIEHRQVLNYLDGIITRLDLPERASYGLVSTIAADLGNTVLFPALTTGGTLHVITSERATNPDALAAYFQQHPIDCLKIVPSHLTALLSAARPAQVLPRQRLILGGEASDWELVERLQGLAPACTIFNHYGPTETTIGVTTYRVNVNRPHPSATVPLGRPLPNTQIYILDEQLQPTPTGVPGELHIGGRGVGRGYLNRPDPSATVPLGRPLPNTQIYILDEQLQPTPTGVPGELHIGGRGVGRGYLNRPDLTVERFIPSPFAADPEARLYKSGDLARYLPDGTIEFLGRIDHQVKIRGFRIELGEIEAVLTQHPAVRTALVQAQATEAGQKQLVAYVVPHTPPAEAETPAFSVSLREFLRARLPDYMLPAIFISLPRLPLTPNGKIDRDALPPPRRLEAPSATTTQPRTETERRLAKIWQQVLGLSQVGVEENFFELGGDSILSIQIIARANQAGLGLTPQQLFQHQTIAALARVSGSSPVIQAEQGLVVGPVPLTPIQQWFFEQSLPRPNHWNMSLLLTASHPLHPERLSEALNYLLVHHDALRLRFEPTPQGWQQHNLNLDAVGAVSIETVDLATLPEAEQAAARQTAIDAAQSGLDLTQGPLLRTVHLRYGPQRPEQLLLVVHHLLVDGVSWRILQEDLQTAYEQLEAGQPLRLPSKTTAFKRWAEALPEYARSTAAAADLAYWPEQLSTIPPVDLPLDFETTLAANTEGSLRTVILTLSEAETRHLLQTLSKVHQTRPHEALLMALVEAVTGWTGQPALLVDLEGHGREGIIDDVDLSRTVGWFTTHFPVWLDVSGTSSLIERLSVIKERLRTIPHHGIGYGLLRYLGTEEVVERLRGWPQPQISFNYLGQFEAPAPDPLFRLAQLSGPNDRHPDNPRSHILHVEGLVLAGQLRLEWLYSAALHRADTIEKIAHRCIDTLRALIVQSLASGVEYAVSSGTTQAEMIYPLAPGQRNILAVMQADPATPVYVVQISLTLNGPLDAARFREAWRQVVARHEALRCCFAWVGLIEPRQIVQPPGLLDWTERDLRDLSETAQAEILANLRRAARERPFVLTERPPLRFTLVRLAAERHELIWTGHHLLKDGWSTAVILKEVLALYGAPQQGAAASLEEPGWFGAYITWLQQQDRTAAAQFWRAHLAGLTEPTPLPEGGVDTPRNSTPTQPPPFDTSYGCRTQPARGRSKNLPPVGDRRKGREGASEADELYGEATVILSAETTEAIQAFARQQRLTLNTLVQAAWALLLGRHTERPEVLFGVVVAGRPVDLAGVEKMVGMLANILPLRVALPPDQPLQTWLQALQTKQVAMRQYDYCPVAEVQSWSQIPPERPLFESVVRFQNQPEALTTSGSDSPLSVEPGAWFDVWPYPLSLVVEPVEPLRLSLHYDRRRFEATTVESLLAEVVRLLARFLLDPGQKLEALVYLS